MSPEGAREDTPATTQLRREEAEDQEADLA